MKIASGRVIGGKVVVEGAVLEEGATVTVLIQQSGEPFELSAEEERALIRTVHEVEGGDVVDGDEFIRRYLV